jgi:hypothetical protein
MQRFRQFGGEVKRAIKTNTNREQKIYDKLQQNVGKIQNQYLIQARAKDPYLDRAMSNEQKRLSTFDNSAINKPTRRGDYERKRFKNEQLEAAGYGDFGKQPLKKQGQELAKGIKWEGYGVMGKFEEFKQKQDIRKAGAQGSRLKEKWAKIASRQRKGVPSLRPSDMSEYAQRIGALAKKYYGNK